MPNTHNNNFLQTEPDTHSAGGSVNINLFPPIDGFCYNQQFRNTPYYDLTHQLARLDSLRRVVNNYQPKIYVYNYELTGTTQDNQPQFRTEMKPGSWIWGYAGFGNDFWFRVNDECTGSPLVSNWVPGAVIQESISSYQMPYAPSQVVLAPPVAVPDPAVVIVEMGSPFDVTLSGTFCLLVAEPGGPYVCDPDPRRDFTFERDGVRR